jgi:hypothetical protein
LNENETIKYVTLMVVSSKMSEIIDKNVDDDEILIFSQSDFDNILLFIIL